MSEIVTFKQKMGPPIWSYFTLIFPFVILFFNLVVGIILVFVFGIGIWIATVEKNKKRKESYTEVEINSENIFLSKVGYRKTVEFSEVHKISFVNVYATNRYEMEVFKVGQEVIFWDAKGRNIASFEYTDYVKSKLLKALVLEYCKLDSSNVIIV